MVMKALGKQRIGCENSCVFVKNRKNFLHLCSIILGSFLYEFYFTNEFRLLSGVSIWYGFCIYRTNQKIDTSVGRFYPVDKNIRFNWQMPVSVANWLAAGLKGAAAVGFGQGTRMI